MLPVDLKKEEFNQRVCVGKALQNWIHEAGIAEIC